MMQPVLMNNIMTKEQSDVDQEMLSNRCPNFPYHLNMSIEA